MPIEAWTNLDLSGLDFILPVNVTHTIGTRYRDFRERTMLAKKQMQDMSSTPVLKPATILRKSKPHQVTGTGRSQAVKASKTLNAVQRELARRGLLKGTKLRKIQGGILSLHPDVPLVDTGNLSKNIVINAPT